jgi:hypothetical protein
MLLMQFDLEYVRQFEMTVSQTPEKCLARVLPTPAINYGAQSKFKQIVSYVLDVYCCCADFVHSATGQWVLEPTAPKVL